MNKPSILSFSPDLSGLELLQSHQSTLESFGKKLNEKTKSIRAAEVLFAAKNADWIRSVELAEEIAANSDRVIVLAEGLCDHLFQAVTGLAVLPKLEGRRPSVELLSSDCHSGLLKRIADSVVGSRVTIFFAFHNEPSERLLWCFRVLVRALSRDRHPDEVARRVITTGGESASKWEAWSQKSGYRTVTFPPRCAGRYLFFSEPTALLLSLLGFSSWDFVEGGRSFFRQWEKAIEANDPMLAYAALREVQLAEHNRETLVLPDGSFRGFGQWWEMMTEDTRRCFTEETNDALVWCGTVMKQRPPRERLYWVTELLIGSEDEPDSSVEEGSVVPPIQLEKTEGWNAMETLYRERIDNERHSGGYARPTVAIALRQRDPFCIGALFAFFEAVVSVSHRLAETSEVFNTLSPHDLTSIGTRA